MQLKKKKKLHASNRIECVTSRNSRKGKLGGKFSAQKDGFGKLKSFFNDLRPTLLFLRQ